MFKFAPLFILLAITPLIMSSFLKITRQEESNLLSFPLDSDPLPWLLEDSEQIGYDVNVTINLASMGFGFAGILLTTQQFDTLFPPMKDINPPQNVTINLLTKISPFTILNFTDLHLSLDLNIQGNVILPEMSTTTPFTTLNITGYATLELVPVFASVKFRLYVRDYDVTKIVVPNSEVGKVDSVNVQVAANSIGQFGIDYLNYLLAQKTFLMNSKGYLVPEDNKFTFQNDYIEAHVKAVASSA